MDPRSPDVDIPDYKLSMHSAKLSFYEQSEEQKLIEATQEQIENLLSGSTKLQDLLKQKELDFLLHRQRFIQTKDAIIQQAIVYLNQLELQILMNLVKLEEEFYKKHKNYIADILNFQQTYYQIKNSNNIHLTEEQIENLQKHGKPEFIHSLVNIMSNDLNASILKIQLAQKAIQTHVLLFQAKQPSSWLLSKIKSLPKQPPSGIQYIQHSSLSDKALYNIENEVANLLRIVKTPQYQYSCNDNLDIFIKKLRTEYTNAIQNFDNYCKGFNQQYIQWQLHQDKILDIAISDDSSTIASCSKDKTICLWDYKQKQLKSTIKGILAQKLAINRNYLICVDNENSIRIWQNYDQNPISDNEINSKPQIIKLHIKQIRQIELNDIFILSLSRDQTFSIWNIYQNKLAKQQHYKTQVQEFAYTDDLRFVAAIDESGNVIKQKWILKEDKMQDYQVWQAQQGGTSLHFSNDSTLLVTCGYFDKIIKIWDSQKNELLQQHKQTLFLTKIRFTNDNRCLLQINEDKQVKISNCVSWENVWKKEIPQNNNLVVISQNSSILVSKNKENLIMIWEKD